MDSISNELHSPAEMRRSFGSFIDLSQKLTNAMRRDFSPKQWEASSFKGWNSTTSLFKKLRNYDQHEHPVLIQVMQRNFYPVTEKKEQHMVVQGTWSLGSPFDTSPPEGLVIVAADPKTGKPSEVELVPDKIEYEFLISTGEEKLQKKLEEIGNLNIHDLTSNCFKVLSDYYDFFKAELAKV
jgi:hypothetical protein